MDMRRCSSILRKAVSHCANRTCHRRFHNTSEPALRSAGRESGSGMKINGRCSVNRKSHNLGFVGSCGQGFCDNKRCTDPLAVGPERLGYAGPLDRSPFVAEIRRYFLGSLDKALAKRCFPELGRGQVKYVTSMKRGGLHM